MRAINASVMRQVNRTLILDRIRKRPISRAELAEETGLTRASVTQIVEELIGEGLVVETAMVGRSRLGRRSTQLAISPGAGVIFGVNLARTQCTVGVIDMRGVVLTQNTELIADRTPSEVLDAVAMTIARQAEALGLDGKRIFGVGVSAPGPVDPEKGRILTPVGFESWHGLPVANLLAQRTGLTVRLETSANAQALETKYFGSVGDTFVMLRIDDTVSAGAVIRGALYRGAADFAAELGCCPIEGEWNLNRLISAPALLKGTAYRSCAELLERRDEPEAKAVLSRLTRHLTALIVNVAYACNVGTIALGGEVDFTQEELLRNLSDGLKNRLPTAPRLSAPPTNPIRMAATPIYHTIFAI